ncbi:transmembrane protein 132E [Coccinella septempunctata]|uniref:transmembrane protein 132E n=1 Tax=Coccinella septempunctata TaxID=41139 RepID=UPI001D089470|nr:transmembrane protein 132E [Coccinella septempunctata]
MWKKSSQVSFWLFFFIIGSAQCVSVHFENKDGGFFLRQIARQHIATEAPFLSTNSAAPLSTDRFTVFQSSQPISIRATYGPFSTKQTVPARYVVPDPLPVNTVGPTIDLQDLTTHHLDVSAHIVRTEIPRDSPVLRVLFHTGTDPGSRRQVLVDRHHQKVCIVLHATMNQKPSLHAACSPDGEDGVCLAQITVPFSYWPNLPSPDKNGRPGKATKTPPRVLQVSYSVLETRPDEQGSCHPEVQIQPSTPIGMVHLVVAKGAYKELKLTDDIIMLVPHPPLFPMSRIHVPVFVDRQKSKLMTAIVIRGRVKSGLKILEATAASDASAWNLTVDINPRHTGATVTLVRREPPDAEGVTGTPAGEVLELFTWLVEVSEDATELYEGTRIVWTARYEPHQDEQDGVESHRTEGKKSTTRFEVQKDDIQAVVPISKNWEVLNTAVLTGRQVSQAMKIFIVSQAGKAADVTFQASCHSEDDSVLKVSSSCSSVYVDGSEARGSVNGSVLVKYGTYTGLARFTVWMPEFPLELQVADFKLSQIKSWRVPDSHPSNVKTRRKKRSYGTSWSSTSSIGEDLGNVVEKPFCRLRYQQTPVDVYAHFMAVDQESGRVNFLINRRTWLRVTDLVLPLLRVSDLRIASLHGRILQGRSMGRTEVQVLSPITGRVIGAKEIRVVNDKIFITKLSVEVVSGLQLNISPDSSIENGYVAETSVTRKLTAQYQEGLLDIELEFSDGSKTPLRDIADSDYHLLVDSTDPEVVAFAPMVASHHPRVIAVGEGSGDLLHVTLLLSEECRMSSRSKVKNAGPLAQASANVIVDFSSSDLPHRPDILQNDGGVFGGTKGGMFQDLQDILKGNSLQEDLSQIPNVQARQYSSTKNSHKRRHDDMNPLEISMYVLLAAFCCAIVVFVISCVVYASKYKQLDQSVTQGIRASPVSPSGLQKDYNRKRETVTNAHDWVWLGRSTVDSTNRNSTVHNGNAGTEMRITSNPLNANYFDPDDALANSFSNPTHIELPSASAKRTVDSTTYCRSKTTAGSSKDWNKPTAPPPLPPHGVPVEAAELSPPPSYDKTMNANLAKSEEYRPPVPPHRNLATPSSSTADTSNQLRKHHHRHHHHNRNSSDGKLPPRLANDNACNQPITEYNRPSDPNIVNRDYGLRDFTPTNRTSEDDVQDFVSAVNGNDLNAFEFDDEPRESASATEEVKMRPKPADNEEEVQFVQYPGDINPNKNARNSAEIKRATIVGNPMFSSNNQNQTNSITPQADLPGLDDLQLDMDYDQIMHYFENLKESNA